MVQPSIDNFAKSQGYETAEYLCEWRGFKCYEPVITDGETSFVGLPLLILEDNEGNIRMSTPEEAMQQIDENG